MIGACLRALQFRFLLSDVNVALKCHSKSNIVLYVCQTLTYGHAGRRTRSLRSTSKATSEQLWCREFL
jgi:hypothetical protein